MEKALNKYFDDLKKNMDRTSETADRMLRAIDQRLAGAEHNARQPRLATEADLPTDKKTRKRAKDAAADQAKQGDNCFAKRVDTDPMMCLTSFGDDSTEPPALPCCRDSAMVDKGAAAPKLCLSPVEIHTLTAAGGLRTAAIASTATRTLFYQLPLWFCPTGGNLAH